jgi:serine/threonine-protein kinase
MTIELGVVGAPQVVGATAVSGGARGGEMLGARDETTTGAPPLALRIGPYEVLGRLGLGGTSEVLLAQSRGPYGFERTVVIKRLLPKCAFDPSLSRMLAREAMAYARLTHPAIVRLYDFFELDGHLALVLEYVDGVSLARLRALLRAQREHVGDAAAIFVGYRIFAALAAAHAARDPQSGEFAPVIHRDVSPGNVLIPWDGFVKLADFGIAKLTGSSGDTRNGIIKGTYGYMAPEQVLGEPVSVRTDVYAGCLLLRELLARRPTFARAKLPELEMLRAMAEPSFPPLEVIRPGVPPALCDALRRGLAPDPEDRTLTAAEMLKVLRSVVSIERARDALVDTLARIRPRVEGVPTRRPGHTPITGVPFEANASLRMPAVAKSNAPPALEIPLGDDGEPVSSVMRVTPLPPGPEASEAAERAEAPAIPRPPEVPRESHVEAREVRGGSDAKGTSSVRELPEGSNADPLELRAPRGLPAPSIFTPSESFVPSSSRESMPSVSVPRDAGERRAEPDAERVRASVPSEPEVARTAADRFGIPFEVPSPEGRAQRPASIYATPQAMAREVSSIPDADPPTRLAWKTTMAVLSAACAGVTAAALLMVLPGHELPEPAVTTAAPSPAGGESILPPAKPPASVAEAPAPASPPVPAPASAASTSQAPPPAKAPPSTASPPSHAKPRPPAAPAPAPAAKAVEAADDPQAFGNLVTPAEASAHRVFVDGKVIGHSGETFRVPCGVRIVKIGSAGRRQTIDVACGGDTIVER